MAALAVVLALGAMVPLAHATGGRDGPALPVALLCLLPALLVVRPWRSTPPAVTWLLAGPALAAIAVCAVTPPGWAGGADVGTWAYAAGLGWVVLGYARTRTRRVGTAVGLCLAGLEQVHQAWLPWWGGQDVSRQMLGTFYWHNQFAAYCLGVALVAGGLALAPAGRARWVGLLVAAFCMVGVLLSTSRASLGLLLVGWLALPVLLARSRGRAVLWPWAATTGSATALSLLVTSPLLMERWGWPTSALLARQQQQGFAHNGGSRLVFWRACAHVLADFPVTGGGFGSFAGTAAPHWPLDVARTPYAHNGLLQAFVDGGLLLGLPVAALVGALALGLSRGLVRVARPDPRAGGTDLAVRVGALLAAGALLAHWLVDFDGTYPALPGLLAVCAALALARDDGPGGTRGSHAPAAAWGRAGAVLLVALVVVGAGSAARSQAVQGELVSGPPPDQVPGLHDGRLATRVVELAAGRDPRVDGHQARAALRGTEDLGRQDGGLQMVRAEALVVVGERAQGLELAERTWAERSARQPVLRVGLARVLRAAGDPDRADAVLLDGLLDAGAALPHRRLFGAELLAAREGHGGAATAPTGLDACLRSYVATLAEAPAGRLPGLRPPTGSTCPGELARAAAQPAPRPAARPATAVARTGPPVRR